MANFVKIVLPFAIWSWLFSQQAIICKFGRSCPSKEEERGAKEQAVEAVVRSLEAALGLLYVTEVVFSEVRIIRKLSDTATRIASIYYVLFYVLLNVF
jgi:hypothetical protein